MFSFQTLDEDSHQISNSQSSLSGNQNEPKKYQGSNVSANISGFISGLGQDIREFLFPTSTISPRTDRNGNVILPIDRVVYESSRQAANITYYEDHFNELPWICTVGTSQDDGIWYNRTDYPGVVMSGMVWLLIIYSGLTVTLLAQHNNLSDIIAGFYCTICALALASHAKTSLTDPGAVPNSAVPLDSHIRPVLSQQHPLCMKCNAFKPPKSHHCR